MSQRLPAEWPAADPPKLALTEGMLQIDEGATMRGALIDDDVLQFLKQGALKYRVGRYCMF
jgi:hypothetical protein